MNRQLRVEVRTMRRNSYYVIDPYRTTGAAVYRTRYEFVALLVCKVLSRFRGRFYDYFCPNDLGWLLDLHASLDSKGR